MSDFTASSREILKGLKVPSVDWPEALAALERLHLEGVRAARIEENQHHIDDIDSDIGKLGPLGEKYLQLSRALFVERIEELARLSESTGEAT